MYSFRNRVLRQMPQHPILYTLFYQMTFLENTYIQLITPQAIFAPEPPEGCVVKSSRME